MLKGLPVGGTPGTLDLGQRASFSSRLGSLSIGCMGGGMDERNLQCVHHLVMGAVEEELVNDSVDAHRSADKFEI